MQRRSFLTGCAAAMALPAGAIAGSVSASVVAQPVQPPRLIDGLSITTEDGAKLSLSDWRDRWVLLAIWSPWCLPCRVEMPALERLERQFDPERMALLPLAFDGRGPRWVRKFYRENGITDLPVYMGDAENLDRVVGLTALPSAALIDPAGKHVASVVGPALWDDAETLRWLQGMTA